jgi:signal transduction histidine kinase
MALAAAAFYIISRNTLDLVRAQRNIEELNRGLEERVNERTTDLTRANDEIQRFAYIVSHDLRAPLVNIVGFTSELETGTATLKTYFEAESPTEEIANGARTAAEQEIPEALQFIRASTTKMDRLIGSILKLSREGRRQLKRERVDLTTLIEATVASVNHQIESAGTEVRIEAPLPSVVADRLALEQIFGNLIDNAIKYLSPNRQGLIIVTGEEFGGRVKIKVADNGRGIDKADSDRIFELFRRAGQQNKPGEGVGLAHVRALTRRLGGDVGVTSELGIGSTFEVDLPKKQT